MSETETRPSPREDADEAYRQFMAMDDETFAAAYAQRHGMTQAEHRGIETARHARHYEPPQEIAIRTTAIVNPTSGIIYDLEKPEDAAQAITDLRELEERLKDWRRAAELALVDESRRLGTKTLRIGDAEVTITGGPGNEIDAHELTVQLRAAGCPEERIAEAVVEEISYKVNWSVCRQLSAANPDYARAVEASKQPVEKRYGVKVKTR